MDHPRLLRLVETYERGEKELRDRSLDVWAELLKAEPELAAAILGLFSTHEAAANWATSSSRELGDSPARHAAEGRGAEIMSIVREAGHGFVC